MGYKDLILGVVIAALAGCSSTQKDLHSREIASIHFGESQVSDVDLLEENSFKDANFLEKFSILKTHLGRLVQYSSVGVDPRWMAIENLERTVAREYSNLAIAFSAKPSKQNPAPEQIETESYPKDQEAARTAVAHFYGAVDLLVEVNSNLSESILVPASNKHLEHLVGQFETLAENLKNKMLKGYETEVYLGRLMEGVTFGSHLRSTMVDFANEVYSEQFMGALANIPTAKNIEEQLDKIKTKDPRILQAIEVIRLLISTGEGNARVYKSFENLDLPEVGDIDGFDDAITKVSWAQFGYRAYKYIWESRIPRINLQLAHHLNQEAKK